MKTEMTTALFIEILVSGILTTLWLILAVAVIYGHEPLIEAAKDVPEIFAVVLLGVAYAVGVVFDRIWDFATEKIDSSAKSKHFSASHGLTPGKVRAALFKSETNLGEYVSYIRVRMRISRAALCNFPIIAIFGIWFALQHADKWTPFQYICYAVIFAIVISASFFSYRNIANTYYEELARVGKELEIGDK